MFGLPSKNSYGVTKVIVECRVCKIKFNRKPSEIGLRTYCSNKCYKYEISINKKINPNYKGGMYLKCSECGASIYRAPYALENRANHFCSKKCLGEWHSKNLVGEKSPNFKNKTKIKVCSVCGKKYKKNQNPKFCSSKCYHISTRKYKILQCANCGKDIALSESKLRWKTVRGHKNAFCSRSCFRKFNSGENHPCWIKDRSKLKDRYKSIRWSKKMSAWRNMVYKRDDWTCQLCGDRSRPNKKVELNCHHIKTFNDHPELRFDESNGVTLCRKCHEKTFHKEKEFEEKYWTKRSLTTVE